ncbi:MAG TPA: ABC transporter permease subunit [Blastocatellia bacterium]|nr:ABC transporter permease subunit [Blastocatellia bacterium]
MAVYEHTYQPYPGKLTPERTRFLVIPRYAWQDVFSSRLFGALFVVCFVPVLIESVLIYLHHNTSALAIMNIRAADLFTLGGTFFRVFSNIQEWFAFILTMIVGPPLISRDLSNNALPLYLCRPFSRAEYVLGKMMVLIVMLSAITWIPGLLMFIFQCFLDGTDWMWQNLWIAGAIFVSNWSWIILLTLLSTALSALLRWRLAASAAIFAFFTISVPVSLMITGLFRTRWGMALSPSFIMQRITESLFRNQSALSINGQTFPVGAAWFVYAIICALCLLVLTRRVRAYEVVK